MAELKENHYRFIICINILTLHNSHFKIAVHFKVLIIEEVYTHHYNAGMFALLYFENHVTYCKSALDIKCFLFLQL